MSDTRKSTDFLDLALDDYLAARLLLRSGLLSQGLAVAATAVEKHLKAALALKNYYLKKHLESGLLQGIEKLYPSLYNALDPDFLRYLKRGFMLRYATVDSDGFSIVINQHRTLVALDETMVRIDNGFLIKQGSNELDTPLRRAVKAQNSTLLEDNVPLGGITLPELAKRVNKMFELKVDHKLATMRVQYETEGLNIVGDFCKKSDIGMNRATQKLSMG
ncbi:HEPN domain-containing protein [Nevskia soli]|uniref:HEPN domain-containing protein n=1 Tax=Nevskia soli TaxID=418856 RepID=UPI0004A76D2A|nr:HEPN domain-containing protein [Nevskia soli]